MFDFSDQALAPGKTIEIVLNQLTILGEHPVLICEHLGETNATFWNDAIAKTSVNATDDGRRQQLTSEMVAKFREKNRETVIAHSCRDTRGFYHQKVVDGRKVFDTSQPATKADIREIVLKLPNEVFDSVLKIVANAENYRDRPIVGDATEIAGK